LSDLPYDSTKDPQVNPVTFRLLQDGAYGAAKTMLTNSPCDMLGIRRKVLNSFTDSREHTLLELRWIFRVKEHYKGRKQIAVVLAETEMIELEPLRVLLSDRYIPRGNSVPFRNDSALQSADSSRRDSNIVSGMSIIFR